jgi:hypothetical protein
LREKKNFKKKTSETLHVSAVPSGASNLLIITCKHKSIHQLLGLIQWLRNEKKNFLKNQPKQSVHRQCPGASNLFTITCKHEFINQLLGLIQWLKNEKKIQIILTPDTAGIGIAKGLQIHRDKEANSSS